MLENTAKQAMIDHLQNNAGLLGAKYEKLLFDYGRLQTKYATCLQTLLQLAARAKLDPKRIQEDAWLMVDIKKIEEEYAKTTEFN